ncbi:hypothetical protein NG799_02285 [Laspinema sp. D1]|uniref:Uncharacterized protein n=1 Tax=Laspinema palackyanum D2a TaxID=2953684 RepID=A0ABT2MMN4_9CYAN|nr:hypothetical protein [Laspinema sp. D2a]
MGKTEIYGDRPLVAVKLGIPNNGGFVDVGMYGFRSPIDGTEGTTLGHTPAVSAGVFIANLVITPRRPRPPRLTRKAADYTVSSFCAYDQLTAAAGAGWKQSDSAKFEVPRGKKAVDPYFVEIRGIKYGFYSPKLKIGKIQADLAALGVQVADGSMRDICWGTNYPVPPRVAKQVAGTGTSAVDTVSTFCDPIKLDALPPGYFLQDGGRYGDL